MPAQEQGPVNRKGATVAESTHSPAHSAVSLPSRNPTPHKQVDSAPFRQILSTPALWEVMSAIDDDEDMDIVDQSDAGLVSWDRMDVLMKSFEYSAPSGR